MTAASVYLVMAVASFGGGIVRVSLGIPSNCCMGASAMLQHKTLRGDCLGFMPTD